MVARCRVRQSEPLRRQPRQQPRRLRPRRGHRPAGQHRAARRVDLLGRRRRPSSDSVTRCRSIPSSPDVFIGGVERRQLRARPGVIPGSPPRQRRLGLDVLGAVVRQRRVVRRRPRRRPLLQRPRHLQHQPVADHVLLRRHPQRRRRRLQPARAARRPSARCMVQDSGLATKTPEPLQHRRLECGVPGVALHVRVLQQPASDQAAAACGVGIAATAACGRPASTPRTAPGTKGAST